MILYVTEQGAEVGLKRARIEVRKGEQSLDSVRLDDLEQLVLYGNIQVTTQASRALLQRGLQTVFLSQGGSFLGRLCGATAKNANLRRLQYLLLEQPHAKLDLARRFVRGKLRNQRALLLRYQQRHPNEEVAIALTSIRLLLERLEEATSTDSVRGFEGRAAANYFGAFGQLLSVSDISFERRMRRPPPDPVNILLSFGYTLLGHLIQGYTELAGLDPYYGALHEPEHGRPSLALDLLEEWRPVIVDTAVLFAINTQTLRARDFVPAPHNEETPIEDVWEREDAEEQGNEPPPPRRTLLLTREGSKRWFTAYEQRLNERVYYPRQDRKLRYRQILREQVYLLARHIRQEEEYESFFTRT